jgi:deoxyribose-phosphate aldolase
MGKGINTYLDSAVLKPEMTRDETVAAIKMAVDYKSATVCVRPCDIDLAKEMSSGSVTGVSVVLSFPHGSGLSEVKAMEAKAYIEKGVDEIDMVVNYGYIRSGLWDLVEHDIRCVTDVTRPAGVPLKVILESTELTLDEVAKATEVAIKANADFVKTSTGFASGGASEEAVKTMLETAKGRIKVKPSGGIRDFNRAKLFVDMGVDRLGNGFSSLPAICDKAEAAGGEGY